MRELKNSYYAFRHGESRANVEGIIVSDPSIGTVNYGLTEEGSRQVHLSLSKSDCFSADMLIISSDFKRAAETAGIIRDVLGAEPVRFDERLQERFFGDCEGKPHIHYSTTWEKDADDSTQAFNGSESTQSVRKRMWSVVESLEEEFSGRRIILVSHGDPLMLLQTACLDMDPKKHRTLPYFSTAEWRLLNP